MLATHPNDREHGTPSGIRTRDLHLERVTSWAARLWGQRYEDTIALAVLSKPLPPEHALLSNDRLSSRERPPLHLTSTTGRAAVSNEEFLLVCGPPATRTLPKGRSWTRPNLPSSLGGLNNESHLVG